MEAAGPRLIDLLGQTTAEDSLNDPSTLAAASPPTATAYTPSPLPACEPCPYAKTSYLGVAAVVPSTTSALQPFASQSSVRGRGKISGSGFFRHFSVGHHPVPVQSDQPISLIKSSRSAPGALLATNSPTHGPRRLVVWCLLSRKKIIGTTPSSARRDSSSSAGTILTGQSVTHTSPSHQSSSHQAKAVKSRTPGCQDGVLNHRFSRG